MRSRDKKEIFIVDVELASMFLKLYMGGINEGDDHEK